MARRSIIAFRTKLIQSYSR